MPPTLLAGLDGVTFGMKAAACHADFLSRTFSLLLVFSAELAKEEAREKSQEESGQAGPPGLQCKSGRRAGQ